ncbi:MAG: DUF177 domain-containing protein [Elusimicrobiota bacterium]
MSSPLRFDLSEVKDKGELSVAAETAEDAFADALNEGTLVGPVRVTGVIRRIDDDASFQGSARGRWRFECTRCLSPIEKEWTADCDATAPIDGGTMDLVDDVRQAIILEQPMKIVCRPDCQGLCPVCRLNLNDGQCSHRRAACGPD